ncbi:hypothetical protein [Bacillus sp. 1P06AnD]|uniref:hypothetical protein n=1 Tax=Bacillus sp. 1P06AnD TaxID=3132208 RepID=UPI0039A0136B
MMRLIKIATLVLLLLSAYKYRYKWMNQLLGNPVIRRFVVAKTMKMPFMGDYMMQTLFRP